MRLLQVAVSTASLSAAILAAAICVDLRPSAAARHCARRRRTRPYVVNTPGDLLNIEGVGARRFGRLWNLCICEAWTIETIGRMIAEIQIVKYKREIFLKNLLFWEYINSCNFTKLL